MAAKYIILGATFNGDGTTSSEAASDGAVGAWNQQSIITNTAPAFGTLADGDTVNIRSKTSGGADLLITFAVNINIGKSGLVYGQRVNWVLDDGTIWAGINGTLTFQATGGAVAATVQVHNTLEAKTQDAITILSYAGFSASALFSVSEGAVVRKARIDNSPSTGGPYVYSPAASGESVLDGCSFKCRFRTSFLIGCNTSSVLTLIAPDIEITDPAELDPIFRASANGAVVRVLGGRLYGAGVTLGLGLVNGLYGGLEAIGFEYDKSIVAESIEQTATSVAMKTLSVGGDSVMGSAFRDWSISTDSRDYINLPHLNASTPGAAPVAWSVQVKPSINVSSGRVARLAPIAKMYEAAAAVVTLRFELLVENTFATIDASTAYLYVIYTDDTTGNQVCLTSRGTGALAASTAAWSAVTYGAESFTKQKIEVTTTSTVRQYTPIFVQLCVEAPASIASKYLIVCPDVQIV